jgi:hypothetical protein
MWKSNLLFKPFNKVIPLISSTVFYLLINSEPNEYICSGISWLRVSHLTSVVWKYS